MKEPFLGTDLAFSTDFVLSSSGDVDTVSGRACLSQDLVHALTTPKGDLWCHANYGIDIYKFLHIENTAINRLDLEQEVISVIEADPRVKAGSASASVASWDLNRIKVKASCTPIDDSNPINMVLGYGLFDSTGEVVSGL